MPAISVLMPCYNAAKTLDETLETLDQQTISDFEVVAVDDGSDDDTAEILATGAARSSNFRVLSRLQEGISPALN